MGAVDQEEGAMFSNKASRDPRLTLPWFRLTLPAGGQRLVTPVDVSKERLGLSPAEGVQVYRDGLGRVIHVPVVWSKGHTERLSLEEVAGLLPEMTAEVALKRFPACVKPGVLDRFKPRRSTARPVSKAKVKATPRSGLGPNVEIKVLRRGRKLEAPAE